MTTTKTKDTQWYAAKTGNHQGLVIEEDTGRNVAVAYDKKDTPLLAAAPAMLRVLKACIAAQTHNGERSVMDLDGTTQRMIWAAVSEAEGK